LFIWSPFIHIIIIFFSHVRMPSSYSSIFFF
jgi:hypothetical protein